MHQLFYSCSHPGPVFRSMVFIKENDTIRFCLSSTLQHPKTLMKTILWYIKLFSSPFSKASDSPSTLKVAKNYRFSKVPLLILFSKVYFTLATGALRLCSTSEKSYIVIQIFSSILQPFFHFKTCTTIATMLQNIPIHTQEQILSLFDIYRLFFPWGRSLLLHPTEGKIRKKTWLDFMKYYENNKIASSFSLWGFYSKFSNNIQFQRGSLD